MSGLSVCVCSIILTLKNFLFTFDFTCDIKKAQPTYYCKPHIICQRPTCDLQAVVWHTWLSIRYMKGQCGGWLAGVGVDRWNKAKEKIGTRWIMEGERWWFSLPQVPSLWLATGLQQGLGLWLVPHHSCWYNFSAQSLFPSSKCQSSHDPRKEWHSGHSAGPCPVRIVKTIITPWKGHSVHPHFQLSEQIQTTYNATDVRNSTTKINPLMSPPLTLLY